MTTSLKEYTYGEARYEVLKELDTRGPIGHYLLKRHPNLTHNMEEICRVLENAMTPDYNIVNLGNIAINIKEEIQLLLLRMPAYLVLESQYNWTPFLSGLCLLITNFLNAEELFYDTCDPADAWVQEDKQFIAFAKEQILAISNIIEIGVSYMDLLRTSSMVVQELQTWQDSKPQALRLSEMYLHSLGIVKGD